MKLFFFIVAICLVLLRAYFAITTHGQAADKNKGTITVEISNYYAQVKWSGKIVLDSDEASIKNIPPGGFLQFKENDTKMLAESDLKGVISYSLYDGNQHLPLNDSGRNFIRAAIAKMIAWGFYADGRAERINQRGGYQALLAALPLLKMQNIKTPYIHLLLNNDSLSHETMASIIQQMSQSVADIDKEQFLKRIPVAQRKDSSVMKSWLTVVAGMNADVQKRNLLSWLMEQDTLNPITFTEILSIANHFNADIDKRLMYEKMSTSNGLTEADWVQLLQAAGEQHASIDISNTLINLYPKMPLSPVTKAAYIAAAKKIQNDADFGKAIKRIE